MAIEIGASVRVMGKLDCPVCRKVGRKTGDEFLINCTAVSIALSRTWLYEFRHRTEPTGVRLSFWI